MRDYKFVYETLVVVTVVQLSFLLPGPSNHTEHPQQKSQLLIEFPLNWLKYLQIF